MEYINNFDPNYYLQKYPDVQNAVSRGSFGGDPYNHYLQSRNEARFANKKEENAFTKKDKREDWAAILYDDKNYTGQAIFYPKENLIY